MTIRKVSATLVVTILLALDCFPVQAQSRLDRYRSRASGPQRSAAGGGSPRYVPQYKTRYVPQFSRSTSVGVTTGVDDNGEPTSHVDRSSRTTFQGYRKVKDFDGYRRVETRRRDAAPPQANSFPGPFSPFSKPAAATGGHRPRRPRSPVYVRRPQPSTGPTRASVPKANELPSAPATSAEPIANSVAGFSLSGGGQRGGRYGGDPYDHSGAFGTPGESPSPQGSEDDMDLFTGLYGSNDNDKRDEEHEEEAVAAADPEETQPVRHPFADDEEDSPFGDDEDDIHDHEPPRESKPKPSPAKNTQPTGSENKDATTGNKPTGNKPADDRAAPADERSQPPLELETGTKIKYTALPKKEPTRSGPSRSVRRSSSRTARSKERRVRDSRTAENPADRYRRWFTTPQTQVDFSRGLAVGSNTSRQRADNSGTRQPGSVRSGNPKSNTSPSTRWTRHDDREVLRDAAIETAKKEAWSEAAQMLSKEVVGKAGGVATEALGFILDAIKERNEPIDKVRLKEDPRARPVDSWNGSGWVARANAQEKNWTAWNSPEGRWYYVEDPKYQPKMPYTVLWRPGSFERGHARAEDKIETSDAKIIGAVAAEKAKSLGLEKMFPDAIGTAAEKFHRTLESALKKHQDRVRRRKAEDAARSGAEEINRADNTGVSRSGSGQSVNAR